MEDGSSSTSPEPSTPNAHSPAKPKAGGSTSAPMAAVPRSAPSSGTVAPLPPNTSWARESTHPITWVTPTDLPLLDDAVMFEESQDAGATWTFVRNVQAAEEYYRYSVPATGPAMVRLRLTFGRTDGRGYYTPLRSFQTPDVSLTASQKKAYTWTKVANDAPFGARDGAGGVVYGGKLWLLGGWNGGRFPLTCANDVWSSPDGATWTLEKANTFLNAQTFDRTADWEGRHFAGYQIFGGQMWIIGGDPIQGSYQTDSWSSSDGRTWTRRDIHTRTPWYVLVDDPTDPRFGDTVVDPSVPAREFAQFGMRTLHITGVFQNKLWVMGGQRVEQFVNPIWPGAPGKVFNDVWSSADGATYTPTTTRGPMWAPRAIVSEVVEHDGRMWLVGGGTYDDPGAGRIAREYRNDVWSTKDGASWEETPDPPPFSPRIYHNVKSFDGRLWVINGYDGPTLGLGRVADNLRDVWYTVDGKNWYDASPPETFVPRHAGTVWVKDGAMYVGSGNAIGHDPDLDPMSTAPDYKWHADVWKMTPSP